METLRKIFSLPDPDEKGAWNRSRIFLFSWIVAACVLTLFQGYYLIFSRTYNLVPMFVLELATMLSFVLYRRGHPDLASNLLVWSFMAGLFGLAVLNDGLRDSAFHAFPAILIAAALLLERRHLVGIAVSSFIVLVIIGVLQLNNLPEYEAPAGFTLTELFNLLTIHGATIILVVLIFSSLRSSQLQLRHGEAKLSESEMRYRELFGNANLAIFQTTREGRIIAVNPAFARTFGYSSPEELLAKVHHPAEIYADPGQREEWIRFREEQPTLKDFEILFKRKGGTTFLGRMEVHQILDPEGRLNIYQGFIEDITERRRREEELQASEARFRAIIEHSYDGIILIDDQRNILFSSPSYSRLLGYQPEEMVGRKGYDFIHPDHLENNSRVFHELIAKPSGTVVLEYRARHKDGTFRWLQTTANNVLANPMVGAVVLNSRDITDRKIADSALLESRELIDAIVNSTADMIWSVDSKRFGLLTFNDGLRNYFLEKRGLSIQVGDAPDVLLPTPEFALKWIDFYRKALTEGPYTTDYNVSAGSNVLQLTFNLLRRDGMVYGISVFGRDITVQKKAVKELRRSLAEKETLLRELYHRTQNNMAVIMGLLDMQAVLANDADLTTAFTDAQLRIRSMALVHQKLYAAQDLSRINLKEYIAELVSQLSDSCHISDRITVLLEVEPVTLLIDSAIPCGLVLNELITNAFRHAFPDGRKGQVRIGLHRIVDGTILLEIADNGVGLPSGFDLRRDGRLGAQNIFSLVEDQLHGKLVLDTGKGISWRIEFRDDLYRSRV